MSHFFFSLCFYVLFLISYIFFIFLCLMSYLLFLSRKIVPRITGKSINEKLPFLKTREKTAQVI